MDDQRAFAALSGDHNPMHVDSIAARRTQAGAPVVHGIRALLWALDELARTGIVRDGINQIAAQFRKFMYLGVPYDLVLAAGGTGTAKAELRAGGLVVTTIQLRDGARQAGSDSGAGAEIIGDGGLPKAPALSELSGMSGQLKTSHTDDFARLFPALAGAIAADRVAALAALSRLVGMVCPGLHSIFAGLTIDLVEAMPARAEVGFKVTAVNERYRMLNMDVAGGGLAGKVTAFVRWPPIEAPPVAEIAKSVTPQEFAGTAALVVGGSRGLGAVTAKAIATGGGKVAVTYQQGRDEAEKLASEINAACGIGTCIAFAYDCSGDPKTQLADLKRNINQLYYFATPPIFPQISDAFTPELFQRFSAVYVDGFANICRFIRAQSGAQRLTVFYPSSVAVAERPVGMTEYAMAKTAGETLCADLMREDLGLRILVSRLPRVLTDQTATVAQAQNADPLAVMLPLIREMQNKR
jgi:NAD(P)-dependent dehydrogenase (short-subunit alcohol dehydrogenase family)